MKNSIKNHIDNLNVPEIYSLMLFILYKVKDIPEYATLSKLCYMIDGNSLQRLLTYFAGQTVTFPSESDFTVLTSALLMYKFINMDGMSYADAQSNLGELTAKQRESARDLYLKIIPIVDGYAEELERKHG